MDPQATFPTRVGSSSIGTGRGTGPLGLGLFYQFQIDAPAGDLGRRRRGRTGRKATRLAHLWQAHRLIAEARGKAIRAKRTEQNSTN